MPEEQDKLEARLIKESWINPANFIKAKAEQTRSGKSLYCILVRMGYMSEQRVYEFFSQQALIPFVKIADYKPDVALVKLFPESAYRDNCFFPLTKIEDQLYVCMANPLNTNLVSTIEMQSGMQVFPVFACASEIVAAINAIFGPDDRYFDLENLIVYPQTTSVMPFWRESDRALLKLDVELKPVDERMQLISGAYVPATTVDISTSGRALGVRAIIFLPPTVKVMVRFPSKDPSYEAKGEIARCNMEKGGKYVIGIRFLDIKEELLKTIAALADKPGSGTS